MIWCRYCGWEGQSDELTSINDDGNDLCPACGRAEDLEDLDDEDMEEDDMEN